MNGFTDFDFCDVINKQFYYFSCNNLNLKIMAEQLKYLYNKQILTKLGELIKNYYQPFDKEGFLKNVFNHEWGTLELKQRMRHISITLHKFLPISYQKQLMVLKPVAEIFNSGFFGMVFPDFVELYGQEDWRRSIPALEWFTQFSSSEFAIRPFILADQEKMMAQMLSWSKHENFHVRRFASEGCRPRLPWAMALPALKKDPRSIFPILENLKNDPEEYVRRSVANNLNDISKDNEQLVIEIAKDWKGISKEVDWIVKHACRTLLKKGNVEILALFGFKNPSHINVEKPHIVNNEIKIGADLHFEFTITTSNESLGKVRLEYVIDYVKKNKKTSPKIFQISESTITSKSKKYMRKQSFKDMSTRKHYPGKHCLSILINGVKKWETEFSVI